MRWFKRRRFLDAQAADDMLGWKKKVGPRMGSSAPYSCERRMKSASRGGRDSSGMEPHSVPLCLALAIPAHAAQRHHPLGNACGHGCGNTIDRTNLRRVALSALYQPVSGRQTVAEASLAVLSFQQLGFSLALAARMDQRTGRTSLVNSGSQA